MTISTSKEQRAERTVHEESGLTVADYNPLALAVTEASSATLIDAPGFTISPHFGGLRIRYQRQRNWDDPFSGVTYIK
jgi:hypothetical protein